MAYGAGSEYRGINIWRRFYFAHILPKDNGAPMPPKLCLHNFRAEGKPEFTGATEENQIGAINEYLRKGMKPDVWWIDAGWYPCDYNWPRIGTWKVDEARFPRGLAPIGEACKENDIDFLLWFEPERVRKGEEIDREHPEWLLSVGESDNKLFDLGNPEARAWITDRVNSIIKASGVKIYEYTPGFIHSKMVVADDAIGVCGSVNFDYRSLYLHFECAALIYDNPAVLDMKRDFMETLAVSEEITPARWKEIRGRHGLVMSLLRLFAPLL